MAKATYEVQLDSDLALDKVNQLNEALAKAKDLIKELSEMKIELKVVANTDNA